MTDLQTIQPSARLRWNQKTCSVKPVCYLLRVKRYSTQDVVAMRHVSQQRRLCVIGKRDGCRNSWRMWRSCH